MKLLCVFAQNFSGVVCLIGGDRKSHKTMKTGGAIVKIKKWLRRVVDELGIGGYNVNLLRNYGGKEDLPLWLAALVGLWVDAEAFLRVRVFS